MRLGVSLPETLDIQAIRSDFPILGRQVHGLPLVYLDNAATTQKPRQVIHALVDYYENHNANVHRGLHTLAEEATAGYEDAREAVARFIGAPDSSSIVFVRNTTEAINLLAQSWAMANLGPGDAIALSQMEHHANLVPWQRVALATGATLRWIEIRPNGELDLDSLREILSAGGVRLVTIAHASNVLGTVNPVSEVVALAREHGALVAFDGAQAAPHLPLNVEALDCDFYALSAHKMLGPTGIGALYGKRELLDAMEPFLLGGSMITRVTYERATWQETPYKFEAGTPNIADAVGWAAAIQYLERLGIEKVLAHERTITEYAINVLSADPDLEIYGPRETSKRVGVVSFNMRGVHAHDVAQIVDAQGVAVRAGHHCCAPLMGLLRAHGTARASFYVYNTLDEVDALVAALKEVKKVFKVGA